MARTRILSSFFVFVVVEHDGHVLLIRERKHGQLWYAPAGGLEPGESVREAAIRETMEEAGIRIEPTTLLNIEQQWYPHEASDRHTAPVTSWWRFVLLARPIGNLTPKAFADEHSLEARWVRPEALSTFALRHPEVIDLVALAHSVASGASSVPCCNHPRGHQPIDRPKDWSTSRSSNDKALSNVLGPPSIGEW